MKKFFLSLMCLAVVLTAAGLSVTSVSAQTSTVTYGTYIVQPGDTLYTIALRYCTTYPELARINGLADPNKIYVGQTLIVPLIPGCVPYVPPPTTPVPGATAVPPSSSSGVYDRGPMPYANGTVSGNSYTVAWGDNLSGIATRFGVTVDQLMQANGLTSTAIYAGQILIIPGLGSTSPPANNQGCTLSVNQGKEIPIYQSPNTASPIVGSLSAGMTVPLFGQNQGFYQIYVYGGYYWVQANAANVTTNGACANGNVPPIV